MEMADRLVHTGNSFGGVRFDGPPNPQATQILSA